MVDNSIANHLHRINQHLDNSYLLANPFFRLTKPTPENLSKYNGFKKGYLKLRTLCNFTILFPFVIIQGVWNIVLSCVTPWEWYPTQQSLASDVKFLGVSQITTANQRFENDPLYGQIPELLIESKNLGMFYLNGTRKTRRIVRASLIIQNKREVLVNSKTLSPLATMMLIAKNLEAALSFVFILKRRNLYSERILYIVSKGLLYQFRRATFANLIFLERLSQALEKTSVETIFFTMEGHAHEAALINLIKIRFPHIRIKSIQHAPIVPSQVGYFENLLLLRETDAILCTGVTMQEITTKFLQDSDAACRDVRVLGSTKSYISVGITHDTLRTKKQSILFLPEGTQASTIEFLDLLNFLAKKYPEMYFVFRMHPATQKSVKLLRRLSKQLPTNAAFSRRSLALDLADSLCCIYRSSASAIEGLAFGVTPIHFQSNNEFDLDPILNDLLEHPHARDYSQLETVLEGLTESFEPIQEGSKRMQKYFKDYYSPLRINALE